MPEELGVCLVIGSDGLPYNLALTVSIVVSFGNQLCEAPKSNLLEVRIIGQNLAYVPKMKQI